MEKKTKRMIQGISVIIFAGYLILMTYFLFFAESLGRSDIEKSYRYNLHLFREIRRFWEYREKLGMKAVLLNLFGNVGCFVPFGAFLPILFQKARRFPWALLCSFGFSLLIECIQLLTRTGSFDVDDLMLNTIGGVLGFLIFTVCNIFRRNQYG